MKVAIVGGASSTREQAFRLGPDWQIWGLAWKPHLRVDRLFEIHDERNLKHGGEGYWEKLKTIGVPLYMRRSHDDIPTSISYPIDQIRQAFPGADIFTSSISYMLALAIESGAREISVYGVDMLLDDEYAYQRPTVEYLIGLARGRLIKVTVPEESSLCKANFVYGEYISDDGPYAKATGVTEEVLQKRLEGYKADWAETDRRIENELARLRTLDGAIQEASALLDFVRHFNRGGVIPT